MGDETLTDSESHLAEIEEGRVINNLHLLELKLVGSRGEQIDPETQKSLLAIQHKGSRPTERGNESRIFIFYNTKTGQIEWPSGSYLGDSSVLRTMLVEREGVNNPETKSREILLYRPGNVPSGAQYAAAMMGEEAVSHGHRRIMPERIDPNQPGLQGIEEVWGQTEMVNSVGGDIIMLRTIREFNTKYGPER